MLEGFLTPTTLTARFDRDRDQRSITARRDKQAAQPLQGLRASHPHNGRRRRVVEHDRTRSRPLPVVRRATGRLQGML